MAGKLIEPKVITDFNNKPVCILPAGFFFDDTRWDIIWSFYDKKGESLTMEDLYTLFPDEETVKPRKLVKTGELNLNDKN